MSRGRKTFNLQSTADMEEFKKLIRRQYGYKEDATGVETNKKHRPSVRHLRPASGENG